MILKRLKQLLIFSFPWSQRTEGGYTLSSGGGHIRVAGAVLQDLEVLVLPRGGLEDVGSVELQLFDALLDVIQGSAGQGREGILG